LALFLNILCPVGFVGWVFVYYKPSDNKFQFRQALIKYYISLIFLAVSVMVKEKYLVVIIFCSSFPRTLPTGRQGRESK